MNERSHGKQEPIYEEIMKKQAEEDVKKIRPILEKDPDWTLVSSEGVSREDKQRQRRALTRLTKKAVNLLFPEFKASAHHDRGTARHWVTVNITVPGTPENALIQEMTQRAEKMLVSSGLKYAAYFPDSFPGKDDWSPCLLVKVNHFS